jgi:hypothetical protein
MAQMAVAAYREGMITKKTFCINLPCGLLGAMLLGTLTLSGCGAQSATGGTYVPAPPPVVVAASPPVVYVAPPPVYIEPEPVYVEPEPTVVVGGAIVVPIVVGGDHGGDPRDAGARDNAPRAAGVRDDRGR